MGYENNDKRIAPAYSQKVRAGKKRTYFFDIKETRNNTYSLIITESRKRFDDRGFDRTSIYVYQEDINKFVKGLEEAVVYIKTELLPNYDFDEYSNDYEEHENSQQVHSQGTVLNEIKNITEEPIVTEPSIEEKTGIEPPTKHEEVDKW